MMVLQVQGALKMVSLFSTRARTCAEDAALRSADKQPHGGPCNWLEILSVKMLLDVSGFKMMSMGQCAFHVASPPDGCCILLVTDDE